MTDGNVMLNEVKHLALKDKGLDCRGQTLRFAQGDRRLL